MFVSGQAPGQLAALVGVLIVAKGVYSLDSYFVSTHKTLMQTRFDPISYHGKVCQLWLLKSRTLLIPDTSTDRSLVTSTISLAQASSTLD